ncbi:DeoR/GlpR family DNA-binding transcription regulator [Bacillaceae bacterium S4-13-56]
MLSVERQERIVEELNKKGTIKVSELSKKLHVTEKTIRMDLEILESDGFLKRVHGGAVLPTGDDDILPIKERQAKFHKEKRLLAKEALHRIVPGDTILLDGGSTTSELADLLGDYPVTVITNDIKIANILLEKDKVELLVIGGTKIGSSSSLVGSTPAKMLEGIHVNQFFVGSTGVDLNNGLTVFNSLHADWKRQIMTRARKTTLLADSTKFGKTALIQFASLKEVDEVITDSKLDPMIKKGLEEASIHLTIVDF